MPCSKNLPCEQSQDYVSLSPSLVLRPRDHVGSHQSRLLVPPSSRGTRSEGLPCSSMKTCMASPELSSCTDVSGPLMTCKTELSCWDVTL